MAREFKRTDRLGDAIQRILAQLIQFEVRDPRIGMVNLNDVVVSRDLSFARVYVTFVGKETEQESLEAAEALNKASGFLRSQLAKELDIRTTPRLQFIYDKTSVQGQHLSQLIDKAVRQDRGAQSEAQDQADEQDTAPENDPEV
ncbi:30S ribosome-binding factor RbfA [Aestuariicella hydrocarbonica]|uniref:Ribosome-binding factor A n=1 Tax=Pseudomaricurvus hydrocarbonicus TaxID=1470433 RepID=A0A9E5JSV8_9GAMM|nr:30S ribosome-binding factor RbfA [Aestuariicella hydrocarbonica]NHO64831.1 30S ribosome-binding factor RbfA [Aestuariicella hydrocarbonica]